MRNFKKMAITLGVIAPMVAFSQTQPQGTAPATNAPIATKARAAWYRGGNNFGGGVNPPGANIFGAMWNSPIYTYTNGIARMVVNGTNVNLCKF